MKKGTTKKGWGSIVMGCYNGAKYIERSCTSILNQSYPNIQFVFINDGSKDVFEEYVMGKIDNYAGTYLVRASAVNEFY